MKVEVTESKKNDLLGRTEISGKITFEGPTPKRGEVLKAVAAATKSKEKLTVVKKINSHYGGGVADVTAFAYTDPAVFEKIEREYMRTRNVIEEPKVEEKAEEAAPAAEEKSEEAAAEKPAEEPAKEEAKETPAEKPAEEPKEEKPEEKPAEKKEEGE